MSSGDGSAREPLVSNTADLVAQARAGDARAREELALRYRAPLARLLHSRLSSSARGLFETDDIVQEALAAALLRLERFEYRGVGSFWSYLRRIGFNLITQAARNSAAGGDGSAGLDDSHDHPPARDGSPLVHLVESEQSAHLEAAIERLPQPARDALLLRMELDLPYDAIAHECGFASADAARMAVCRAMDRLATEIARAGLGEP
jgi:RNA polymerase sigma-70 factor (ECF subfamily)